MKIVFAQCEPYNHSIFVSLSINQSTSELKFNEIMRLPWSEAHKYMDISDFIRVVNINPDIDLARLEELGELVYSGGGKEILEKVRQVQAGEKLVL